MHWLDSGGALCSVCYARCRCKLRRARLALCKGRLYRRVDAGDERLFVVADIGTAVVAAIAAAVVAVATAGGNGLLGKCRECKDVPTLQ